jgi:uncharacterized OB-fold protein
MSARVLPDVSHPDFAPFWEACARARLVVPQCANGHLIWPPRPTCPRCVEPVATWTEVRGAGRLYSWTVVHRTRLPWYAERTPYVVGIVTIDHEQPLRMVGRCEIALEDLREGVDMVIDFEDAGRQVSMPFWRRPMPEIAGGSRHGR